MGMAESGEKVIGGFFASLKDEPLSLALCVMNLTLLGLFFMILTTLSAQREREVGLLYQDKKEVRELLARCVVPDRRTEADDQDYVPLPRPRPRELGPPHITDSTDATELQSDNR